MRMCAVADEGGVRLQKALARAGVASRRNAELLIEEGRVEVDGRVVTEFGVRVDPEVAVIRVDGERIQPVSANVYLVFNKPRGVVTTMSDPQGRPCIADYVQDRPERLFHIGRLDTDTQGLLLLTNHGELAHRLAPPSYEVSKTYVAEVDGNVKPAVLRNLLDGVELDDGPAQADTVKIVSTVPGRTLVQITLHEGRNRIVRRMFDAVGHPVKRLTRTAIGPVRRGNLHTGQLRDLDTKELGQLLDLVDLYPHRSDGQWPPHCPARATLESLAAYRLLGPS